MNRRAWRLIALLLSLSVASSLSAADVETEVREQLNSYIKAFNSGDASALADYWAEDAVSIDQSSGNRVAGREAIVADFESLFAHTPGMKLSGTVDHVESTGADVAVAEGTATVTTPGRESDTLPFSATLTKADGVWMLQEVLEGEPPAQIGSRSALEQLDWLLGNWRDDTQGVEVNTSVRRSPNDAFLIRSFEVDFLDGQSYEGTQIIGWDPHTQQLRTWAFNSDGSFGDGYVSQSGDAWLFRMSSTGADGARSTSTHVITPVDANTLQVEKIGQSVNGLPTPAGEPIRVVRVDAAENALQTEESTQ